MCNSGFGLVKVNGTLKPNSKRLKIGFQLLDPKLNRKFENPNQTDKFDLI